MALIRPPSCSDDSSPGMFSCNSGRNMCYMVITSDRRVSSKIDFVVFSELISNEACIGKL